MKHFVAAIALSTGLLAACGGSEPASGEADRTESGLQAATEAAEELSNETGEATESDAARRERLSEEANESGNTETATFDDEGLICEDGVAMVGGSDQVLTFEGFCNKVIVGGTNNMLSIDRTANIQIGGTDNRVEYRELHKGKHPEKMVGGEGGEAVFTGEE